MHTVIALPPKLTGAIMATIWFNGNVCLKRDSDGVLIIPILVVVIDMFVTTLKNA